MGECLGSEFFFQISGHLLLIGMGHKPSVSGNLLSPFEN